jgi:hypothetical protein
VTLGLRIFLCIICPLFTARIHSRGFPQMGGSCLLKYNGGDSGIKIPVLYWRYSLIRVSVIRGSTVLPMKFQLWRIPKCHRQVQDHGKHIGR